MTATSDETGESGGSIPGAGAPAFRVSLPPGTPVPVLIAAPHGGRCYPAEVTGRMRDPAYAALRLEDRHIDLVAESLAQATGAGLLIANAPRAMLDLNRAPDDVDWSMIIGGPPRDRRDGARHSLANRRARSGLGLVPRRLSGLGEIWKERLDLAELDARISAIHRPYHAALASALEQMRDRWGAALLIDLHSMPPLPKAAQGAPAAEFVLGDRFGASCDRALIAAAVGYFESHGRQVAHNRPYAGGYVLDRHAAPQRRIHAIQLEVCRASYLDAAMAEPSGRAAGVARLLAGLVRALAGEVAALGGAGALPLAAE